MATGSTLCTITLMLSFVVLPPRSSAQEVPNFVASNSGEFRTDRLSQQQIRIWNAIRKIVLARDAYSHPMHPTLYGLWCTVEQSDLLVIVELITDKKKCSNQAGECAVGTLDPSGRVQRIGLRLFIPTIDRAYAGEQPPKEGMAFVPFSGLSREKRYAKVLGHELAHIERAVRDPAYLRLLQEICAEQLAIAAGIGTDRERLSAAALKERWARVWPLVLESDKPAIAAEEAIYRELLARK